MSPALWDIAVLLSKWFSYLAMITVPGAVFVSVLASRADHATGGATRAMLAFYLVPAAVVGVLSTSVFFLLQVGTVNQQGVAGMFDPVMADILARTVLGEGLGWRLSGFFLALVAALLMYAARWYRHGQARLPVLSSRVIGSLAIMAMVCVAISFAVLGHSNTLDVFTRAMVVVHVSSVCLWIGSLIPLYILCRDAEGESLQTLLAVMRLFGHTAWFILAALLISGGWLVWQLAGGLEGLIASMYGRILSVKLLLVAGLLGFGAWHKYRLVPQLKNVGPIALRRSIAVETALAALILLVTAVFTTVAGPVN